MKEDNTHYSLEQVAECMKYYGELIKNEAELRYSRVNYLFDTPLKKLINKTQESLENYKSKVPKCIKNKLSKNNEDIFEQCVKELIKIRKEDLQFF